MGLLKISSQTFIEREEFYSDYDDRSMSNVFQIEYSLHISIDTGELGYDGPLYDGFLHMTDNMLGPSPMHIKYLSYVYDGFCI